jgi:hypothetical protein
MNDFLQLEFKYVTHEERDMLAPSFGNCGDLRSAVDQIREWYPSPPSPPMDNDADAPTTADAPTAPAAPTHKIHPADFLFRPTMAGNLRGRLFLLWGKRIISMLYGARDESDGTTKHKTVWL